MTDTAEAFAESASESVERDAAPPAPEPYRSRRERFPDAIGSGVAVFCPAPELI